MDYNFFREFEALKNIVILLEERVAKLEGKTENAKDVQAIKN